MRFLVIDDSDYKIQDFVRHLTLEDSYMVRKSYRTGLMELSTDQENYDCLILDMNFPNFYGGRIENNKGLDILVEMQRKRINLPTVVYSSDFVDTSKFSNVMGYINLSKVCDMKDCVDSVKMKLEVQQSACK